MGGGTTSYSPVPRTCYGPGQVSLGYISMCMAYHHEEDGGGGGGGAGGNGDSADRASLASTALPLFLLGRVAKIIN